ncbi:MAG: hypothetical protein IJV17_03430 [Prevotella sp.]|nr:hypothetical protein [Prevotella sp.]
MKKVFVLWTLLMVTTITMAQEKKFSPEKFEADLEAFVTKEAKLTDEEAKKFFPLFRELHQKQRDIYRRMRQAGKSKPADDKAAAETIVLCDKLTIEAKQLEQKYHNKMIKEIPASKVYQAINAENRFHRKMMKGWQASKGKPMGKRH